MLTIEDLRNPKRKSGFDHVNGTGVPGPKGGGGGEKWRAYFEQQSTAWLRGPRRGTPEEAAQDYCDYMNNQKPITIEDIRNPKRQSGFDHVSRAGGRGQGKVTGKPWRAFRAAGHGRPVEFRGPRRGSPEEAAQDWCDYINGQRPQQRSATLNTAGHTGKREPLERDPEVEAALGVLRDAKGQREGRQGYVYLIVEDDTSTIRYGKIGYSTNPQARVAELQSGNPRRLRLYGTKTGTKADEAALHVKYRDRNALQEWFWTCKDMLEEFDPVQSDSQERSAA